MQDANGNRGKFNVALVIEISDIDAFLKDVSTMKKTRRET